MKQGFWYSKLSVSFKKFSRRHSMFFNKYTVSVKRHIPLYTIVPKVISPLNHDNRAFWHAVYKHRFFAHRSFQLSKRF